MSFLDKLEHIIKVDLKLEKLINIKININSNNKSKKIDYNPEQKILKINLEKFGPQELKDLKPIMQEAVNEGIVLLEEDSEKRIEDIRLKETSRESRTRLKYFKDKIPKADYKALRASLYLKKLFEGGADKDTIYRLKSDIIHNFSTRGLNISNLCSAGYFDTMIKPLYDEMKKDPEFTNEKFMKEYDIIINEAAFAVFVRGSMQIDHVKKLIEYKIKRSLKYGVKFVNIHGIGKNNIKTIREALSIIETEYPDITKTIEREGHIIFVKLRFLD